MNLLSTTSRVQAPVIIAEIGNVTFGLFDKKAVTFDLYGKTYNGYKITYPNYMKELRITKVNGSLNNYTLMIDYPITATDDPNLIDKILSKVSKTRTIKLTYGDATTPAFMYRQEEALITKVKSSMNYSSSSISYTINAVSTALKLNANKKDFEARYNVKPSDVIKELLKDKSTGLTDIFYGMHDFETVENQKYILSDDTPVNLSEKLNTTVLDYLIYLVNSMSSINDENESLQKSARYTLTMHDNTSELMAGPYFKINKVYTTTQPTTSLDYYTIDIGYPGKDLIYNFSINQDDSYAILYDYANGINADNYIYRMDNAGNVNKIFSPSISNSSTLLKTTEADRTWWSQMTQFPIRATLQIRGLLRAIMLMSYLKINVYYYGNKHNSSGLYIVNKQEDTINSSGYTTTLNLVRIGADDDYARYN